MVVDDILNRIKILESVTKDNELSNILDVNQRTLAGWKLRKRIPYEYIEAYATPRHISLDYIMSGVGYPYTQLVGLGNIQKDIVINDMINIPLEDDDHTDVVAVPKSFLSHSLDDTCIAYYMQDDSMEQEIPIGSIFFVSKKNLAIKTGKTYRVKYDDEIYIKRIFKTDKGDYTLLSNDEKYPKWNLKREDFEILGQVVVLVKRV